MEFLPKDRILEFRPDTFQAVRKAYNLDKPGAMSAAIDSLDDWVKKQNHFTVRDFDRSYLERTIITCKGSVEKAKSRLDKLCTCKTLMSHFFGDYDANKDLSSFRGQITYCPLPKLTQDHNRIYFFKNSANQFHADMLLDGYKFCAMQAEYLKAHDYANSYTFVVDMRTANIAELALKLSITDTRQLMTLLTEGYGVRLSGIHLVSTNKLIDTFVSLLKTIMSEKIGNRIQVHKSMDDLYNMVPKEVFPKDYGGDEKRTLEELEDLWFNELSSKEYRNYWREMTKATTDESCRSKGVFNEQYLGMPGTFRTLSVD